MTEFFKKIEFPKYMNIPWEDAEVGKGFVFTKSEIGTDGKKAIENDAAEYGIKITSREINGVVYFLVKSIAGDVNQGCVKIYNAIKSEPEGITWSKMQRKFPYSEFSPKELKSILMRLEAQKSIEVKPYTSPKGGRPTNLYTAI